MKSLIVSIMIVMFTASMSYAGRCSAPKLDGEPMQFHHYDDEGGAVYMWSRGSSSMTATLPDCAPTDGTNGTNGTNGTDGKEGVPGVSGAQGAPGSKGPAGVAGPIGTQGPPGEDAFADKGVAGAIATAAIAHPRPGDSMVGVGIGHYATGNALALGGGKSWLVTNDYFDEVSAGLTAFIGEDDQDQEYGVSGSLNFHF